jgi:hypothetical protein
MNPLTASLSQSGLTFARVATRAAASRIWAGGLNRASTSWVDGLAEYARVHHRFGGRVRPNGGTPSGGRLAVTAERRVLIEWRQKGRIYDDAYHLLEEELDRAELHVAAVGATAPEG